MSRYTKMRTIMKLNIFLICLSAPLYITPTYQQEISPFTLSFDSPCAITWFNKTLNACMHTWDNMRTLIHAKNISACHLSTHLDTLIGRLVYADFCIDKIDTDNRATNGEDMVYLHNILKKITVESAQLTQLLPNNDQISCFTQILLKLNVTVDTYLTNHASL